MVAAKGMSTNFTSCGQDNVLEAFFVWFNFDNFDNDVWLLLFWVEKIWVDENKRWVNVFDKTLESTEKK